MNLSTKPPKLLHRGRQFLEQLVLQRLHDLGVELLAECGEAAEVGEQDRDGAAIGFRVLASRAGGGRSSAAAPLMAIGERWRRGRLAPLLPRLDAGLAAGASPSAPHRGQKAKSGAQAKPQLWQTFGCFAPHLGQNAKPLWIWKPQSAQFIEQIQRAVAPRFSLSRLQAWTCRSGRASASPSLIRSCPSTHTS